MERTLVICKPDSVERGLVGEIIGRFESKGLRLAAAELRTLDAELLARHYAEHVGKGFYGELVEFMSRGPVLVAVVEGPRDTANVVRTIMGATDPAKAAPGTIRGDFATLVTENLVHGSDSPESARREIELFYPNLAPQRMSNASAAGRVANVANVLRARRIVYNLAAVADQLTETLRWAAR